MVVYFTSVLGAALAVAVVNLLAPESSSKIIRLVSSLMLICVLIAPLPSAIKKLADLPNRLEDLSDSATESSPYKEQMEQALNQSSRSYFAQALTQMLESRFEIPSGEIRVVIRWAEQEDAARPEKITVILSGSAKWKNPSEIEEFVSGLLGCECVSAIE